jgi:hypothetical protein
MTTKPWATTVNYPGNFVTDFPDLCEYAKRAVCCLASAEARLGAGGDKAEARLGAGGDKAGLA